MTASYTIGECIFESRASRVCRAVDSEGTPVVVKQLRGLYPPRRIIDRFRREYEITRSVTGPGVIAAYALHAHEGTVSLVVEDFGAQSLAEAFSGSERSLLDILRIALCVSKALDHIHHRDVVHKDINPANIVWNRETDEVKLIDFGISQVLSRESHTAIALSTFEGTPTYMSPEQTGRMNRVVDCRSDLYSFGATLYDLVTGCPPFESDDRFALVHAHIAKTPVSARERREDLPEALSTLIMTLLAKRAEDRYQSASGLHHDLSRCLEEIEDAGNVSYFELRQRDHDERLRIPQHLYGRDNDVKRLIIAFERAAANRAGIVLVTGPAGIGKTSLVHEVQRSLASRRGSFVEGKFDQFNRGTPYDSLIQAFRNLVRHILTESAETVADWKIRITTAVGPSGGVLIQVIPEIEHVIGAQPELEVLPAAESRNRFQLVIGNFVRAMAWAEHPVVIFLDDLQWADLPSIELIDRLATDPESRHLLLIGAYRDNEVDEVHPLSEAINRMRNNGASIETITLAPLDEEDVLQLVGDTVGNAKGYLRLAVQCHAKTGGNAFFLNRFLEGLYDDGHLHFDAEANRWTWDPDALRAQAITANVVEFMSAKIRSLPESTGRSLAVAACVGNTFDLQTLAAALELPESEVLSTLREALGAELVEPVEEGFWFSEEVDVESGVFRWRFVHDRIRQSAYALVDHSESPAIHRRIGTFMLEHLGDTARGEHLFELVEQLNRGIELIADDQERSQLCDLNLAAARRATDSAAFAPAHAYYEQVWTLLGDDGWTQHYEEALAVCVEGGRAAYLSGDHDAMELRVAAAMAQGRTVLDRVAAQEVRINGLVTQARFRDAVQTAAEVLAQLGVELSLEPSQADVEAAVGAALEQLQGVDGDTMLALPEATDPAVIAAMRIQNCIMSSAYLAVPALLPILATNIVRETLKHGACKDSAYGFSVLALVLVAVNHVDIAYSTGQLALKMLDRWDDRTIRAKNIHVVGGMVNAYVEPLRDAVESEQQIYQLGIDTGDLEYAAWGLHTAVCNEVYAGVALDTLEERLEQYIRILEHHRQNQALHCTYQHQQAVRCLRGEIPEQPSLSGPDYDAQTEFDNFVAVNFRGAAHITAMMSSWIRFLFRDLEGAKRWANLAGPYADGATATYHVIWWHQYRALINLALCDTDSEKDVAATLTDIEASREQLETWRAFSPVNHDHRVHLLDAEVARVESRNGEALEKYDAAIDAAQRNGFLHEEALANELAGRFHLARGSRTVARAYLLEAAYCYGRWGATAKTAHLEQQFAQLFAGLRTSTSQSTYDNTMTTDGNTSTRSADDDFDLDTLFKAATVISSEIRLDNVLGKVMEVAIENAGATRGFLIMDHDGEHRVDSAKDADGNRLAVPGTALEDCAGLPVSIVSYVARTGEGLVMVDARDDPRWIKDSAIPRDSPTSVLCTPVVNQGVKSGIILLCNDLIAGAFTPGRIQVLQLLSSQAAISIQNARLYDNLDQSLAELQRTIDYLRRTREELDQKDLLVYTDELTGLYNRRCLMVQLPKFIERAEQAGSPLVLLFIDLDRLKSINDSYGHAAGDAVLRSVGERLLQLVRQSDLPCRLGGDEFAVVLTDSSSSRSRSRTSSIHRELCGLQVSLPDADCKVAVSMGGILLRSGEDLTHLMERADESLYLAKNSGRGLLVWEGRVHTDEPAGGV